MAEIKEEYKSEDYIDDKILSSEIHNRINHKIEVKDEFNTDTLYSECTVNIKEPYLCDYLEHKGFVCKTAINENYIQIKDYIEENKIKDITEDTKTIATDNTTLSEANSSKIDGEIKIEEIVGNCVDDIKIELDNGQLYCDNCHENYQDYCTQCRMLVHILDRNIIDRVDNRVGEEMPKNILEIRESFGCFGIFAIKHIPEGVKFGPFAALSTSEYSWKIKGRKLVVSNDESKFPHWLHYINSARSPLGQNLLPFQYESSLYYRSVREILEGEELFVYFGVEYEDDLIKDIEVDFIPITDKNVGNVFACTFCCMGFSSELHLTRHKIICSNKINGKSLFKEIVQCSFCKIYLETREYLDYHIDYCREKHTRRCVESGADNRMGEVEGRSSTLNNRNKQQCKLYKCSQCKYRTTYRTYFQNHTNKHYEVKTHKCGVCHARFTQKETLKRHMINIHTDIEEKEVYQCSKCDFKTNYKWNMKDHTNAKHCDPKKFKCRQCAFETNYKRSLKEHVNTKHCDVKRFKCPECEYKTNRKSYLKMHVNIKHCEKNLKHFKCSECEYETHYKRHLKTHVDAKHCDVKQFKCPTCEFKTNNKSHLKVHINVKHCHENEKRFKCPECEYKTSYIAHLNRHAKGKHAKQTLKQTKCEYKANHTNSKRHTCTQQCDDKLKRFKCPDCEYKTYNKSNLKRHINAKHCENRQFKCSKCDYQTTYKSYLEMHIIGKHSRENGFKCSKCEFKTNYKLHLKRHINAKRCERKV